MGGRRLFESRTFCFPDFDPKGRNTEERGTSSYISLFCLFRLGGGEHSTLLESSRFTKLLPPRPCKYLEHGTRFNPMARSVFCFCFVFLGFYDVVRWLLHSFDVSFVLASGRSLARPTTNTSLQTQDAVTRVPRVVIHVPTSYHSSLFQSSLDGFPSTSRET